MKLSIGLFLLISNLSLYAQNATPVYVLEYTRNTKAVSEVQKAAQKENMSKIIGNKPNSEDQLRSMFSEVGQTSIYYRKDTVLIISTHDGVPSKQIGYQHGGIMHGIDLKTGQSMVVTPELLQRSVDNAIGQGSFESNGFQNTSSSIRKIKNKELVQELVCEKWQESLPQFQSNAQYWILPGKTTPFPFPMGSSFLFHQGLIVKSEIHSIPFFEKIETQELTKIDSLTQFSILGKVNNLLKQNLVTDAYQNLAQNKNIDPTPLSINTCISDLYFLELEGKILKQLTDLPGQWDYLLIDIWASWCGPCIKAFPELHKLKQNYQGSLELLSLNYADTNPAKVEEVQHLFTPDWPQGYASHQLHDLLNPMRMYPAMVLLDRNKKVVMIGKPSLSFNAIRKFLDEHIVPRK